MDNAVPLAISFLLAIVLIIYYFFKKDFFIRVHGGGGPPIFVWFKPSMIEGIPINEDEVSNVIAVIRKLVLSLA